MRSWRGDASGEALIFRARPRSKDNYVGIDMEVLRMNASSILDGLEMSEYLIKTCQPSKLILGL
jgi:hypothetical protein